MKTIQNLLFVFMGLGGLLLIIALVVALAMPNGLLGWLQARFSNQPLLHIYVQAPPLADVGEEVKMIITVRNTGEQIQDVTEIRLPKSLLNAAVVTGVFPGSLTQANYDDSVGYPIGFMLAPDQHIAIEVVLMPRMVADVLGDVQVMVGEKAAAGGFRLVFIQPVAENVNTATPTLTYTPTATWTPTLTPTPVTIPYQTVIQLFAKYKYTSRLRTSWSGSGTIISPDGLILTNAHLVTPPSGAKEPDFYAIALTLRPEQEPIERYYAEVVEVDKDLDLAVLRITTDLDYRPVDPASLQLPYVTLGDSNQLQLGDPLLIVGYPGIGGKTITVARGEVGGYSGTRKYGERTFIKTTASVTGGMSGGMVMDQNGYMVGIPTQIGNGIDETVVDCRIVADTDGNGKVNQGDACVPTGGFVNALRPINLALPMIRAAMAAVIPTALPTASPEVPLGVTPSLIPTATLP